MPRNEPPADGIDWSLTTWDGARREQLRRWAALPLEQMIQALEDGEELMNHFREMHESSGSSGAHSGQSSDTETNVVRGTPAEHQVKDK